MRQLAGWRTCILVGRVSQFHQLGVFFFLQKWRLFLSLVKGSIWYQIQGLILLGKGCDL